ncbi:MAG: nitroreductase/quinone reductase family protein [Dehalococcoidia bacterium]
MPSKAAMPATLAPVPVSPPLPVRGGTGLAVRVAVAVGVAVRVTVAVTVGVAVRVAVAVAVAVRVAVAVAVAVCVAVAVAVAVVVTVGVAVAVGVVVVVGVTVAVGVDVAVGVGVGVCASNAAGARAAINAPTVTAVRTPSDFRILNVILLVRRDSARGRAPRAEPPCWPPLRNEDVTLLDEVITNPLTDRAGSVCPLTGVISPWRDTMDDSLVNERYCYLTTTGRVSGRPHTIEIWFALNGTTLYVMAGDRDRTDWVRNLVRTPEVGVRIADRHFRGPAAVLDASSEEDAQARRLLVDKYRPGYSGDLLGWERDGLPVAVRIEEIRPPRDGSA